MNSCDGNFPGVIYVDKLMIFILILSGFDQIYLFMSVLTLIVNIFIMI